MYQTHQGKFRASENYVSNKSHSATDFRKNALEGNNLINKWLKYFV